MKPPPNKRLQLMPKSTAPFWLPSLTLGAVEPQAFILRAFGNRDLKSSRLAEEQ